MAALGLVAAALALLGCGYMILAFVLVGRFFTAPMALTAPVQAITILKPLYGAEPRLADNLASFLDQQGAGAVQLLCGAHDERDGALPAARSLAAPPGASVDIVVDGRRHGANGKVSTLANLEPHIAHPLVAISDSDIAVAPDYAARLAAALAKPGIGAVTCLYAGRGDAGFWSVLGAAGLSYQFLPGAIVGIVLGLAQPCMGSTIALRRELIAAIGGFRRFADILADDHAIGVVVRQLGFGVAVPPMLVTHASAERSLAELWRHELRWAATVRGLAPTGYAASVIAYPLTFALAALARSPSWWAGAILLAALASRWLLAARIDRIARRRTAAPLLLPLRDLLSFAVFIASFFVRSVDWRGSRLVMAGRGRIAAAPEIP